MSVLLKNMRCSLDKYEECQDASAQIREHVDGTDLETLMKNPSLCPSLRSPEERMRMAVGIAKVTSWLSSSLQRWHHIYHHYCKGDIMIIIIIAKVTSWLSSSLQRWHHDYHHHCKGDIMIILIIARVTSKEPWKSYKLPFETYQLRTPLQHKQ